MRAQISWELGRPDRPRARIRGWSLERVISAKPVVIITVKRQIHTALVPRNGARLLLFQPASPPDGPAIYRRWRAGAIATFEAGRAPARSC